MKEKISVMIGVDRWLRNYLFHGRMIAMGGLFGVVSKDDCVNDIFYGTDYHSHLGTKRGGLAVWNRKGFERDIHSIEKRCTHCWDGTSYF